MKNVFGVVLSVWWLALLVACQTKSESNDSVISFSGDPTPSNAASDALHNEALNFVEHLGRSLCEHYLRCGVLDAQEVDDCVVDLDRELLSAMVNDGMVCDGMVAFYRENQSTLDACIDATSSECGNDDLGTFCAPLEEFDPDDICAGESANQGMPIPTGEIMAPCSSDSDCNAGMRCLGRLTGKGSRYCSIPCQEANDCRAIGAATFNIRLAEKFHNANRWNVPVLNPGIFCVDLVGDDFENVGPADEQSWCVVGCPEKAAAGWNEDRSTMVMCACLPNHRWTDDTQSACEWDSERECSIFTPCTTANTEVSECSEANFRCIVSESLNGTCLDTVSGAAIEACANRCQWECDSACLANTCGSNPSDACTRACCSSDVPGCDD